MADNLSTDRRRDLMSRVRGKNTSPELVLRSALHRAGFRFRIHRADLPGTPDLVFPGKRKVIFVHGCFWHCHSGCNQGRVPKSNQAFWVKKRKKNRKRDKECMKALRDLGWAPFVVWTCTLRTIRGRLHTIDSVIQFLNSRNDGSEKDEQ
jgi:DNA mismatch endonuclease (patch repair protein)